jgi:hypothetical protein
MGGRYETRFTNRISVGEADQSLKSKFHFMNENKKRNVRYVKQI